MVSLRTARSLYVEYTTGEREYYDLRKDPYELVNTVSRLFSAARRAARPVVAMERCQGARSCRRAGR